MPTQGSFQSIIPFMNDMSHILVLRSVFLDALDLICFLFVFHIDFNMDQTV